MFWGLTLESGKHYSQSVEDSFHVSMAALELEGEIKEGKLSPHLRVMVQHQKKEFLICSLLQNGFLIQQQLDLDFTEGEEVTFYLEGNGVVHLTGYLVQEKPFEAEEEPILGSPPDSSEDGMAVSGDESEDDQAEKLPTLQDLAKSDDLSSDDEDEDDWIPEENGVSPTAEEPLEESPEEPLGKSRCRKRRRTTRQSQAVENGSKADHVPTESHVQSLEDRMVSVEEAITKLQSLVAAMSGPSKDQSSISTAESRSGPPLSMTNNAPNESSLHVLRDSACIRTPVTPTSSTNGDVSQILLSCGLDRALMVRRLMPRFFTHQERVSGNTAGRHGKMPLDWARLSEIRRLVFAYAPMPTPQAAEAEWKRLRSIIDLGNRHLRHQLKEHTAKANQRGSGKREREEGEKVKGEKMDVEEEQNNSDVNKKLKERAGGIE